MINKIWPINTSLPQITSLRILYDFWSWSNLICSRPWFRTKRQPQLNKNMSPSESNTRTSQISTMLPEITSPCSQKKMCTDCFRFNLEFLSKTSTRKTNTVIKQLRLTKSLRLNPKESVTQISETQPFKTSLATLKRTEATCRKSPKLKRNASLLMNSSAFWLSSTT